jgi:hypothetical protein
MPLAPTNSHFSVFVYKRAKLKEEGRRGGVGDGGLEIGRWKEGEESDPKVECTRHAVLLSTPLQRPDLAGGQNLASVP